MGGLLVALLCCGGGAAGAVFVWKNSSDDKKAVKLEKANPGPAIGVAGGGKYGYVKDICKAVDPEAFKALGNEKSASDISPDYKLRESAQTPGAGSHDVRCYYPTKKGKNQILTITVTAQTFYGSDAAKEAANAHDMNTRVGPVKSGRVSKETNGDVAGLGSKASFAFLSKQWDDEMNGGAVELGNYHLSVLDENLALKVEATPQRTGKVWQPEEIEPAAQAVARKLLASLISSGKEEGAAPSRDPNLKKSTSESGNVTYYLPEGTEVGGMAWNSYKYSGDLQGNFALSIRNIKKDAVAESMTGSLVFFDEAGKQVSGRIPLDSTVAALPTKTVPFFQGSVKFTGAPKKAELTIDKVNWGTDLAKYQVYKHTVDAKIVKDNSGCASNVVVENTSNQAIKVVVTVIWTDKDGNGIVGSVSGLAEEIPAKSKKTFTVDSFMPSASLLKDIDKAVAWVSLGA